MSHAKKMADLFDIDLDSPSSDNSDDIFENEKPTPSSFDVLSNDIKDSMDKEDDTVIIKQAVNNKTVESKPEPKPEPKENKTTKEPKKTKKEAKKTLSEALKTLESKNVEVDVDADIADFADSEDETEITKTETEFEKNDDEPKNVVPENPDNPLNLSGVELKFFNDVKINHKRFCLYSGHPALKDFYKYKLGYLMFLLVRFPVLDFKEMSDEVCKTNLDHFVGDDFITPDIIRKKLDDSYRSRIRLSTFLIKAYEQFYMWERYLNLLRSKLHKDYEVKGAHRRDGMIAEHLADMEGYFGEMSGFIEATKHADSILKAAAESLSRQLTCMQLKETLGLSPKDRPVTSNTTIRDSKIDQYDHIADGTVITAPNPGNKSVSQVNYGDDDEVSSLGI